MKIRWLKVSAGIYQTDTGRWRVEKDEFGRWWIFDLNYSLRPIPFLYGDSLREAKQLVDYQIESEATHA